jgi:hypothetical protein
MAEFLIKYGDWVSLVLLVILVVIMFRSITKKDGGK